MKARLSLSLATTLTFSLHAQVLPPDFTLFGKTSGDYAAEWYQYIYSLSTNGAYLFPDASPRADDRVYFLQRTIFYEESLGIQTYTVPDDVYLFFPIISFEWDNVDIIPPRPVEELREILSEAVDRVVEAHASIDGVSVTNLLAYRTKSPVFSVYLPTADNFFTVLFGHPITGLVDPIVAEGYLIMAKPLPPGLHDVRTGYTYSDPNGFSRERHYQIRSVPVSDILARQTEQLEGIVIGSSLEPNRQQQLRASLEAARDSFAGDNFQAGKSQLRAFMNKVRAQLGSADETLAAQLIQAAQAIIEKAERRPTSAK